MREPWIIDAWTQHMLPSQRGVNPASENVFRNYGMLDRYFNGTNFDQMITAMDKAGIYRIGLVNRVVPPDQLESTAREWAEHLAKGPTFAMDISKRLLNRGTEMALDTSFEEEAYAQTLITQSEDSKEGMAAFREKRQPVFKGR